MLRFISAFTLVVLFADSAQAQIAFDSASSGEVSSGTSVIYNHTVVGAQTLLVVGVHTLSGVDVLTGVTYNGAALTLVDKILINSPSRWVYHYAIASAAQGTHSVNVTTSTAVGIAVVSASYTGVQGLPADNSTKQWTPVGTSPLSSTTTLTPNANNTWTILVGATTGVPVGAGSGSTLRAKSGKFGTGPTDDRLAIFDSNGPISPAASTSMTITGGSPYIEFGTVMASYKAGQTTSGSLPLITSQSLTYLGAFRVPNTCGSDNFYFGGGAIAFNPAGNSGAGSMYILSRTRNAAELTIPQPAISSTLSNLPTASCLVNFVEPTEGAKAQGDVSTDDSHKAQPTGMAVVNGKLWINNGIYYDSGAAQTLSLMSRPLNLSTTGQVKGLFGLTSSQSEFIPPMAATSIAEISADWTAAMGGNLFLSKFGVPIISSQSYGPNAIVTNTATLVGAAGTKYAAAATPLFFPGSQPLGGDNGAVNGRVYTTFSQAHSSGSLVQPKGTSSLLAFQVAGATRGTSAGGYGFGYGCGCSTPPSSPGARDCPSGITLGCEAEPHFYDPPRSGIKGTHGYPYVYQIVAFDMNALADVKNGLLLPWQPQPYSYWELTFPISPSGSNPHSLSNATYDSSTNRIYVAQLNCCDWNGLDPKPLIHVFQITP